MSFRHATVARLAGTPFPRRLFRCDAVLTPLSLRAGAASKRAKEAVMRVLMWPTAAALLIAVGGFSPFSQQTLRYNRLRPVSPTSRRIFRTESSMRCPVSPLLRASCLFPYPVQLFITIRAPCRRRFPLDRPGCVALKGASPRPSPAHRSQLRPVRLGSTSLAHRTTRNPF